MKNTMVCGLILAAGLLAGRAEAALPTVADPGMPQVQTSEVISGMVQAGNRIYVCGMFTKINGEDHPYLAAFDAVTGQLDQAWKPQVSLSGHLVPYLNCLAVSGDRLYIGGWFDTVNGVTRNHLAAVELANGVNTGKLDPAWDPNVDNPGADLTFGNSYIVVNLAIQGDRLYAGGSFTQVNGSIPRDGVAAFELADGTKTGAVDAAWNPQYWNVEKNQWEPIGKTTALLATAERIYIGTFSGHLGAYEPANGSNAGAKDPAWNPLPFDLPTNRILFADQSVSALLLHQGVLYVGGYFGGVRNPDQTKTQYPGLIALPAADGHATGEPLSQWKPDLNYKWPGSQSMGQWNNGVAFDLAVVGDRLIVGGQFSAVNGTTPRNNLAAFPLAGGSNTAVIDAWDPQLGTAGKGSFMVSQIINSGPGIMIGGAFDTVNGKPQIGLAGFSSTVPVELSHFTVE